MNSIRSYMKKFIVLLLVNIYGTAYSQSMYWAKKYYDEGKYLEAAKQLRPLADGGNAEAQYMAAELFYYGYGVQENEAQSKKYLTLAADQGYEKAIELLVNRLAKKGDNKAYSIAKKYIERHPYLEKGSVGWIIGACLVEGICGAPKDEDAGWKIIEKNNDFNEWLKEFKKARHYWDYKARKAGKKDIDELAEYYYNIGDYKQFGKVDSCLQHLYNSFEVLVTKADSGSVWAMNQLAIHYNKIGNKNSAISWAQKAKNGGSKRGRIMTDRLSYIPVTCRNISIGNQSNKRYSIESIVLDYDRITINFFFRNNGYTTWIATAEKTYIQYGDKYYKLLSSTLPIYPKTKSLRGDENLRYSYVFYRVPNSFPTFNIIENGKILYQDVQILDKPTFPTKSAISTSTPSGSENTIKNKCYFYQNGYNSLKSMGILDYNKKFIPSQATKAIGRAKELDKESTSSITILGKKGELITPHPEGSYSIVRKTKYSGEIIIKNPTLFWSQSNITIILNDW